MKKLIAAVLTFSLGLSAVVFTNADEAANQEGAGNTDTNSGKSI